MYNPHTKIFILNFLSQKYNVFNIMQNHKIVRRDECVLLFIFHQVLYDAGLWVVAYTCMPSQVLKYGPITCVRELMVWQSNHVQSSSFNQNLYKHQEIMQTLIYVKISKAWKPWSHSTNPQGKEWNFRPNRSQTPCDFIHSNKRISHTQKYTNIHASIYVR